MNSSIRSPKDLWAGIIYLSFGLLAVLAAREYGMGTAIRMGPGYFPTVLGLLLCVIGLAAMVRSLRTEGEAMSRINLRSILLIAGPIILFAMLVRTAGVLIALPILVLGSAYASAQFRLWPTVALAAGLTIFCSLVFVKGLGIPLPLLGSWFGA